MASCKIAANSSCVSITFTSIGYLSSDYTPKQKRMQLSLTKGKESAKLRKDLEKRRKPYEKDYFKKVCGPDRP